MKKLFFLLISVQIFSQNIATNSIDEFTKDTIIQVNASKDLKWSTSDNIAKGMFNNVFLSTKLNRNSKDIKFIQIDASFGFITCFSNNEGKCILLLENESTVTLNQISKLDCDNRNVIKYSISDNDLKILSKKNILKIRLYATDSYIDFEIKDKKKEIIRNHFLLFLQTIQ